MVYVINTEVLKKLDIVLKTLRKVGFDNLTLKGRSEGKMKQREAACKLLGFYCKVEHGVETRGKNL